MRKDDADAVCMQCGLCCDGTFFGSVLIDEGERAQATRVGLRVVDNDGTLSMPQPCSALRGCLCAVYDDRPASCRRYECTMRQSVLDGTKSAEEARASVARMRALLAEIRGAFDIESTSIWEAILAMDEPAPVDPMSAAGRKLDAGIRAVAELLELARAAFEPRFAGGGGR